MSDPLQRIASDVVLGRDVRLGAFINLYGCTLGDGCMIGAFVEIQRDVTVGPRCRVQSHSFLCSGVTLEADVFVGHGVMFINDRHPSVAAALDRSWKLEPTLVRAFEQDLDLHSERTFRMFGLGRNKIRELAFKGDIPGVVKASW